MAEETNFIKDELKKKGYPLENYVQGILASKSWHVYSNAYFLDRETDKAIELDIKAIYEDSNSDDETLFIPQLLIQCKKVLGNAWVFSQFPKDATLAFLDLI